ncbi:unnamed protein product [Medioppia subpectinata]|uniref:Repulsive guidance molecule A n=1 Tax=Medioppia subpectinata TaxID=1979941 RepID=A0A7R9KQ23_9ACAR|nr:unnamed protein product [Medioppia subpectinata]CAG2107711.1 unnamed protein product [Medioppia subpectinata]
MMTAMTMNAVMAWLVVTISLRTSSMVKACSVDMCSREYSSVLQMSQQWSAGGGESSPDADHQYCALVNAYQHCLKSIGRSCRGNLEFHTLQTLLKTWKHERNCSHTSTMSATYRPHSVASAQRKSGHSLAAQNQQQRQQNLDDIQEQQSRLQHCLSAAYNYTINTDVSAAIDVRTDHRTQRVVTTAGPKSRSRGRPVRDSDPSVKTNFFPIRGETIDLDEDMNQNEFNSSPMPPTVPTLKPSVPPSPPLTCIIYGDPHLRTFNNEYQTCRCSGAWPLIDHPLFTVQITNSRIKGANPQVTGVTKVVVLVRQFQKCGIFTDLLYEADSQTTQNGQRVGTPSATFIDGSTSNSNNLIRITQSSNNNVITIHLDHIGVRVYIGQFERSAHLNVVIKFRSATSTVKQQLVLNSISSNSLCKMGCPKRELIDIQNILSATGVDVNGANGANSASQTDNSVTDYKSDSGVTEGEDSDDDAVVDEEDVREDPCHDLHGYYRISCLYDVTIKGKSELMAGFWQSVVNAQRSVQYKHRRPHISAIFTPQMLTNVTSRLL